MLSFTYLLMSWFVTVLLKSHIDTVRSERVFNTCVHAGLAVARKRVVRIAWEVGFKAEVSVIAVAHASDLDVKQSALGEIIRTANRVHGCVTRAVVRIDVVNGGNQLGGRRSMPRHTAVFLICCRRNANRGAGHPRATQPVIHGVQREWPQDQVATSHIFA